MSYILDALKRADADRERGHVPGLHSQTALQASPGHPDRPQETGLAAWRGPALWRALVPAVLAAGAAAWWWSRPASAPSTPSTEAATLSSSGVATAPDRREAPQEPATALEGPGQADAATAGDAAPAQRLAGPVLPILAPPAAPPVSAASSAAAKPAVARPTATTTGSPTTVAARPASPGPAPTESAKAPAEPTFARATPGGGSGSGSSNASAAPVRRFAELPPEVRAQLPAVSISGSTYSQNPAHRMLIANGKVVQEGSEIAAGLTLETIGPGSAVLNHQGVRYSIGY